ncbi:hypothetical protein V8E36_006459 [Tilletia maclaganii]
MPTPPPLSAPPSGIDAALSATWPDSISDILENAFTTSSSPAQRSDTSFSFSFSHSRPGGYAADESLTTVGSMSMDMSSMSPSLLSKVAIASESNSHTNDSGSVSIKVTTKRATSSVSATRTRKARSPQLAGQIEAGGYKAWTLHTSPSGRAVLGVKTRAYETVAAHAGLIHSARVYPHPLTPPPEASPLSSGASHFPPTNPALRTSLDAKIPLEVRKCLRATAQLHGPPKVDEGELSFGSVQEWAESEDLATPPPEDLVNDGEASSDGDKLRQGCDHIPAAPPAQEAVSSLSTSEKDNIKSTPDASETGPASPLVSKVSKLGLLKPPTPSKAQHVFSAAKYDNVLGPSRAVVPLRYDHAPTGLSLRFKRRPGAFTALRVVLEPRTNHQDPQDDDAAASKQRPSASGTAKQHFTAKTFSRKPSLDAVMLRGRVLDRDEGHVHEKPRKRKRAQATALCPNAQKGKPKTKRVKIVRESTPVRSLPSLVQPVKQETEEPDAIPSHSSASEGEEDDQSMSLDDSFATRASIGWEQHPSALGAALTDRPQARTLERYGSSGRCQVLPVEHQNAGTSYPHGYSTRPSFSAERHGVSPVSAHTSHSVANFTYPNTVHTNMASLRGDVQSSSYGWARPAPAASRDSGFARSSTWPNHPGSAPSAASRLNIQGAIRGRYPGSVRGSGSHGLTSAPASGHRMPALLAHLTSEATSRAHGPAASSTTERSEFPAATEGTTSLRPELHRSVSTSLAGAQQGLTRQAANAPVVDAASSLQALASRHQRYSGTTGKMDRVFSAPTGRESFNNRTPLSLLANQCPSTSPGRRTAGDETEQQQAAAELLLAFGQGRD